MIQIPKIDAEGCFEFETFLKMMFFFQVSLATKSYFLKKKVFFIELPFAVFVGFQFFFSLHLISILR